MEEQLVSCHYFLHTISPHSSRSATQGLHQDPTKWPNVGPWPWLKKNDLWWSIWIDYGGRCRVSSCHHLGEIHLNTIDFTSAWDSETLALQISNTSLLLSVADSLGLVTCQVTGFGVGKVEKLAAELCNLAILDNLGSLILCIFMYAVGSLSKMDGAVWLNQTTFKPLQRDLRDVPRKLQRYMPTKATIGHTSYIQEDLYNSTKARPAAHCHTL